MNWPRQSDCDAFYGDPRDPRDASLASPAWESANLVRVMPPFALAFEGRAMSRGILVHRQVRASLTRVFTALWDLSGRSQTTIDAWGLSTFGGAYAYRLMRGGNRLSMHSWGCALDFDPDRNAMGVAKPHFATLPQVVGAFEAEGWVWGGRWSGRSRDGMHFQAARVG